MKSALLDKGIILPFGEISKDNPGQVASIASQQKQPVASYYCPP